MKNNIIQKILQLKAVNKKMLAVLLDPDQCSDGHLVEILNILEHHTPDFVFIGGSHTTFSSEQLINIIKNKVDVDIVLFPGNVSQFSPNADALLYLSLISGRNPDYLIGQHVTSAIAIKNSNIEVIPTAYLLIEGGVNSSVEYISNTRAIPRNKSSIALSTAIAGELLGMKLVYLEAGSGADLPVPPEMIQLLKASLSIPLIVGGGIKTIESIKAAFDAGADLIVVGNAFEDNPNKIKDFVKFVSEYTV